MNKLRKEEGITLIALIITIVVLLILAAVAIGTLDKSNIIVQSQEASEEYDKAKDNEIDTMTKYEEEIEKYIPKENNQIQYYLYR